MKAFKFRLDPILAVRRIQEEQSRAALAKARIEAARAAQETTKRRRALLSAREAGLPSGPTTNWRAKHDRQRRMSEAVLASRAAELRASELVATRVEDWERAAQEVKALERLDERARAAHLAEVLAEEQRDADEQAAIRHARNQRRTPVVTRTDDSEEEQ